MANCEHCGKEILFKRKFDIGRKRFCSELCRKNAKYVKRKPKLEEVVCSECKNKFTQTHRSQKTCSPECRRQRDNRIAREYRAKHGKKSRNIYNTKDNVPVESICPTCRKKHTVYIYPWQNPRNVARCYCPEHEYQRSIKEHNNFAIHI